MLSGSSAMAPVIASSTSARSSTVRAIGPETDSAWNGLRPGPWATRPGDGLSPTTPQNAAGVLSEPPRSEPWPIQAVPQASAACPYPGLLPYDVADRESFFGRDTETAEALARLEAAGALVVAGPSGSGKSSLVRAGVAAALERRRQRVVVVTPGTRPMEALAQSYVTPPAGEPADAGYPAGTISVFRRPLPTSNLRFASSVNWDGRSSPGAVNVPTIPILTGLLNQSNGATMFVLLKPWDERNKDNTVDAILGRINGQLFGMKDALAFGFNFPEIPGLGTTAGLELNLQARRGQDIPTFARQVQAVQGRVRIEHHGNRRIGSAFRRSIRLQQQPRILLCLGRIGGTCLPAKSAALDQLW